MSKQIKRKEPLPLISRVGDSTLKNPSSKSISLVKFNQRQVIAAISSGSRNLRLVSWFVGTGKIIEELYITPNIEINGVSIGVDLVKYNANIVIASCINNKRLLLTSWFVKGDGKDIKYISSGELLIEGKAKGNITKIVKLANGDLITVHTLEGQTGNGFQFVRWRLNENGKSIKIISKSEVFKSSPFELAIREIELKNINDSIILVSLFANYSKEYEWIGFPLLITYNINENKFVNLNTTVNESDIAVKLILRYPDLLVTAGKNGAKLRLMSWKINFNSGKISKLKEIKAGETNGHNVSNIKDNQILTAVRGANNTKLILWSVNKKGVFERKGDSGYHMTTGVAKNITQCEELDGDPSIVTAVQTQSGGVKLISWKINV